MGTAPRTPLLLCPTRTRFQRTLCTQCWLHVSAREGSVPSPFRSRERTSQGKKYVMLFGSEALTPGSSGKGDLPEFISLLANDVQLLAESEPETACSSNCSPN